MKKLLRPPSVTSAVQDYIKQYIIERRLQPGDALPAETTLARELGISRPSVREAVKAMQTLGIVEVQHGNGLFVRGFNLDAFVDLLAHALLFDPELVRDILHTRHWLELAAVEIAAPRLAEQDLAELAATLDCMEAKLSRGEPWREEHSRFHKGLRSSADNELASALCDIFWLLYDNLRTVEGSSFTSRRTAAQIVAAHRAILAAVQAGDVKLVQQRLLEDMQDSGEQVERWLAARGRPPVAEPAQARN